MVRLKRVKNRRAAVEGIVVGDGGGKFVKKVAPKSQPVQQKISGAPPIAKPKSVLPYGLTYQKILVGLGVLLAVYFVGLLYVTFRPRPAQEATVVQPEMTENERAFVERSAQGKIVRVEGQNIHIATNDGESLFLLLGSSTDIKKDYAYVDGEKSGIVAEKEVQVSYNNVNNKLVSIWYDYSKQ